MKFEDFKKLSPETQMLVLILERIERKVDGLVSGVQELEKDNVDGISS